MEKAIQRKSKKAIIKFLFFILYIILAMKVDVTQFALVQNCLTKETLESVGFLAPFVYMVIYATGICLLIPGTLLTGLGTATFGAYWGFLYVWMGVMAGAIATFWIGRTLARKFVTSLISKKLDNAIARNGFAIVLYLRLLFFPFNIVNFGIGLTKVHFWNYFLATGIGIIAGTFTFTAFIGALKEVWVSGNWGELIFFKVFFSVGLYIFLFFLPKIINKKFIVREKENSVDD
jgi:uncharacterized membrane protein YdjX (TVP38/TMEM64 family)